ncbi:MAG: hypothetical protein HKN67_01420, partial [Saprospiraceae bacterium]|nr:hypothetical protein [Saprospiraceae bacterium]
MKTSLLAGAGALTCSSCSDANDSGEKVKVLSTDGTLVEVDKSAIHQVSQQPASPVEARQGIPGKKFVMVIDLGKCRNARKCVSLCQEMHDLPPEDEWIKV